MWSGWGPDFLLTVAVSVSHIIEFVKKLLYHSSFEVHSNAPDNTGYYFVTMRKRI